MVAGIRLLCCELAAASDTWAVNRTEWLTLTAIVVTLIVGVAAVIATRRWGNRRRRLLFSYEVAPLLAEGSANDLLQITYRDFPVRDPHLVTVRLRNVGPADVATGHFDGGRPFLVRLNCKMYGPTRASHPGATVSTAIGAEGKIELRPHLLRKGEEWVVEAVVEGSPEPEYESPLIDTDVVEGPGYLQQAGELLSGIIIDLPFGVTIGVKR